MSAPHSAPSRDRIEEPVAGEGLLRTLERGFLAAEQALGRVLPPAANPLLHTGALANLSLFVAVASGVALLLWYTPSVHGAHASVRAMEAAPLTAGLVRALHRYSSDATVLLVALHAARLTVARRFTGARWLAWVTGIVLVGFLWFVGWLGYWLVWDEPARQIAIGSARLLDVLPIFADPFSRSFLADATLNSLLFFVVFFVHMLLPLAMGIALWLHVARVARSRFLPPAALGGAAIATMVALSIALPPLASEPARMANLPGTMALDAWFLAPLALTDRVGAAWLWAGLVGGGALLVAVPWLLQRGRAPVAEVDAGRCNGCTLCAADCPYDAIRLVPRPDGAPVLSVVDPGKCVGCGICAGSCDSAAIALPWRPVLPVRKRVDAVLAATPPRVAFVCAESVEAPPVPGWHVEPVPCAGWLHPLTVERALKHGAPGVLVVTCRECRFREGADWVADRLAGERAPRLRKGDEQVRVVALDRNEPDAFVSAAADFATGRPAPPKPRVAVAAAAFVALAFAGVAWAGSRVPYAPPGGDQPELVVSFKHPGHVAEDCRKLSPEELAALPPHMRKPEECSRGRASVRLRVKVDGVEQTSAAYAPRGLWGDGNSVAIVTLPIPAGEHAVEVALGETADPAEWTYVDARTVTAAPGERRVVMFDRVQGFSWH